MARVWNGRVWKGVLMYLHAGWFLMTEESRQPFGAVWLQAAGGNRRPVPHRSVMALRRRGLLRRVGYYGDGWRWAAKR